MKIGILSDIHANGPALRAALEAIRARGADRVVCLGDIVGYNTDVAECIALLRGADALCIAGNHDRAVTGQIPVEGFSNTAIRAIAWTRRRIEPESLAFLRALPLKAALGGHLVAVHGALHVDEGCELLRLTTPERRRMSADALAAHPSGAQVCAFGHTHRLGVYEIGADGAERELTRESDAVPLREGCRYLVNPGTVGEPRDAETRATFLLFDTERRVIEVGRAAYDAAAVAERTRDAGLGRRLDFLPGTVRTTLWRGVQRMRLEGLVRRLNGVGPGSWW
ncbi:MAG TPA: metallophosphoesterase family protein [Azospirillum sp.]|nr:metallophosphoesterase family protein [Azospirillum sp.]